MDRLARMIDANANRAREALRVMEDAARFGLDHPTLSAALKALRHDLHAAIEFVGVDRGLLLANRDTPGDVGTTISTPAEHERAGLRDVVLAAGARLSEALRVIEESAKALGRDGSGIERLRYRAYEVEKELGLAMGTGRCPQYRLCVLITEALCVCHGWEEVVTLAVAGGADCVQLREKDLPDRALLTRARRLVEIAKDGSGDGGVDVFINDRPDVAMLAGADGVHLGQTDLSVADVRSLVGFGLLVGVSCSTLEQAKRAVREGADVVGLGPMFASSTKPKDRLAGPGLVREYLADPVTVPHLAISGIGPENIGRLVEVGCRGVAVSGCVCGAEDPEGVCRELVEAMGGVGK
jgi:thiamine-phosphate pyrophosphorylase